MRENETVLSTEDLILGISERRIEGPGKLHIVKWVYDNSDMGLKDSKQFVDDH